MDEQGGGMGELRGGNFYVRCENLEKRDKNGFNQTGNRSQGVSVRLPSKEQSVERTDQNVQSDQNEQSDRNVQVLQSDVVSSKENHDVVPLKDKNDVASQKGKNDAVSQKEKNDLASFEKRNHKVSSKEIPIEDLLFVNCVNDPDSFFLSYQFMIENVYITDEVSKAHPNKNKLTRVGKLYETYEELGEMSILNKRRHIEDVNRRYPPSDASSSPSINAAAVSTDARVSADAAVSTDAAVLKEKV